MLELRALRITHPHADTHPHTHTDTNLHTQEHLPGGISTISCFSEHWSVISWSCDGVRGSRAQKCPLWPKEECGFFGKHSIIFYGSSEDGTDFLFVNVTLFLWTLSTQVDNACASPDNLNHDSWIIVVGQLHSTHLLNCSILLAKIVHIMSLLKSVLRKQSTLHQLLHMPCMSCQTNPKRLPTLHAKAFF